MRQSLLKVPAVSLVIGLIAATQCTSPTLTASMPTYGAVIRVTTTDSLGTPIAGIPITIAQYATDPQGPQGTGGCRGYVYPTGGATITNSAGVTFQSLYQGGPPRPLCLAISAQPPQASPFSAVTERRDSVTFAPVDNTTSILTDTIAVALQLHMR
jgi:hypothetical protein